RLARALARGELSYAKVRALTRVATPETEERLLAVGRAGTAWHVERIVRGWRRVDRNAEARETALRHSRRALRVYVVPSACIRTKTAWWSCAGGWRRKRARCCCKRWPLPARRCTSSSARRSWTDRKSTRLNSSHVAISYAVFCLKKKKKISTKITKQ